jgi:GDPmannose 4,6-dehydratase
VRGETFVTRKITRALARIGVGLDDCLYLGNLDARRDWGHAKDYVRAMWLMLQQPVPEDFVIATGEQHSVREFVTAAARELGIELAWEGRDADEVGRVVKSAAGREGTPGPGQIVVRIDRRYFRPAEVDTLLGDATKARQKARLDARSAVCRARCGDGARGPSRGRARRPRPAARARRAQAQRWLRNVLAAHRFAR